MDTEVDPNGVCELVRKAERDYTFGQTRLSKYVEFSMFETLNKIDAYDHSKHISGETDSQGREKPFFNISNAAKNIWFRATDIDRKDIKVRAGKSMETIPAFMATAWLQNWMRIENFGKFLNQWGRILAKYGSAVSKFVVQEGKLHPLVVDWNKMICDTIDFDSNPQIEVLELTADQLRSNKSYDQDIVEKLMEAAAAARTDVGQETKDNKIEYYKVYELHGKLPLSFLTGKDSDKDEYQQQMQVVTFLASKEKGDFDDFVLFKGREKQSPYQKDDLLEEDGRTLAIGSIENLFEAQWMVNHSMKNIKDQLDLASKLIFQTSDKNFVGTNVYENIEQGDILIHAPNEPLNQVANNSHDITSNQSYAQMWQELGREINGISEAMMGIRPKGQNSGRLQQLQLQESYSLFELMTENKGLAIEQMLRKFILPFAKNKMDSTKEISATLDAYGIKQIDSLYIPNEAIRRHNSSATESVLNGQQPSAFNKAGMEGQVQGELNQLGNKRFFQPSDFDDKTWKDLFENLEWELEIDITGEQKDIQKASDTILAALKVYTSATPEQVADPTWRMAFNKMLDLSGEISPLEIASMPPPQAPAPQNKVSESISFKDLPPDGQQQMAAQAGLKISPPQPQAVVPQLTKQI